MQAPDPKAKGDSRAPFLFAAHEGVNVVVLPFVLGLPYANPNVHIEHERRLAFWLDWSFIIVMTLGIGFLAASMVWKTPLF